MEQDVFQHILTQIKETPLLEDPFPHFYIENLFPEHFYTALLDALPETCFYKNMSTSGHVSPGTYTERFFLPLSDEGLSNLPFTHFTFWMQTRNFLTSHAFTHALIKKFQPQIHARFADDFNEMIYSPKAELVRDFTHYSIGPHTDHPHRAVTLLFYFPRSRDQSHLGTSLYRPKDPSFTCEGLTHHPFDPFEKVKTLPFLPNSLLGFVKTNNSFHGVEPILDQSVERNLMNFYIRCKKALN